MNTRVEYNVSHAFFNRNQVFLITLFGMFFADDAGQNFMTEKELALLKDDALLVSFIHKAIINEAALLKELQNGRIRAAMDYPMAYG